MRRTDPKKQFSKWLARYGAIIWGIYIFAIIALMAYRPEVSMAAVYLTIIVTLNKAWDSYNYNDNSKTEKILLAALDKVSMEINIGGRKKSFASAQNDEKESGDEDEESSVTEEGENG